MADRGGVAQGNEPAFLAGGGELGALVRAKDWSATPLGPVESWPQSLRTIASTCLNSRFPIVIFWGPQFALFYNDGYRVMLGGKHPRSLGQPARECWHEIWPLIGPMLQGVLTRGEATWSENQMLPLERHGFPEECYFTFSYSPIPHEGEGAGGVFCAVTETTRQVLQERRLRALRRLTDELSGAATEVEVCERAAAVLATNPADTPSAELRLRDAAGELRPCTAFGEPPASERFECPFGAPEAPAGVLVAGLSPALAFDEGYRNYLEGVALRIGAAIAACRELSVARERAERLAEIDRAKTAFFSNVSHEFRTPLTLMLGPLEDALRASPPALAGEPLALAYRGTVRLLKLVNTLLDFSRIEAGRMKPRPEDVELGAFTADLASAFRSAVESAGLALEVSCEPIGAHLDPAFWEKIVLNLVSNAFKFTPEGTIRVSLRAEGGDAVLEVADTGPGVAESDLPRLFRRFERIENPYSRTAEGTGIGLALVQELAQILGGGVEVASEPGRGTRFTVRVPRGAPAAAAPERQPPSPAGRADAFVQEALLWTRSASQAEPGIPHEDDARILVVDDNADLRDYLRRLLSAHWTVDAAEDGQSALERLSARPYDLVIADVMMPRMGGFELLEAVRRRTDTHDTRFVLLSARAGEEARIEGLLAGADDYLVKPFSGRELVARVRSQLQLKRARHDFAIGRLQVLARQELAHREAQIQRDHLRRVLAGAPTPMAVLAGERFVVEIANEPMCEAWQVRREDLADRPLAEALPWLRDQPLFAQLEGVYRTGEPFVGRRQPFRDRSGALVHHDYLYAPLRRASGEVEGILVLAFDVMHPVERAAPAR